MNQEKINTIMEGMNTVNIKMAKEIEAKAPMCHFRKMSYEQSDSVDGYYTEWWECTVCGHIKDL